MSVIDVHTHSVPRSWPDLNRLTGGTDWPALRVESEREALILLGEKPFRAITSACWDAEERLRAMDADGVSHQVVSPTPVFFSFDRPAQQAAAVSRVFNDLALETTNAGAGRLIPFCQVPLQDPDLACQELDRCMDAGHVGVEIGNHVGDADLDSAGVVAFLQHCADRDVPVFVHPWDMPQSPRLERWMAQWLVGMPAETHLSILALILGGALDRVPETLRIAFAHGGGSFAHWLGRLDNAWHRRHDAVGTSKHPPAHYLTRFFVDTVVFDEPALRLLADTHGVKRLLVGSDYPYPLGERPAGAVVDKASFLDDEQRRRIRHTNAVRFLGPRAAPFLAACSSGGDAGGAE